MTKVCNRKKGDVAKMDKAVAKTDFTSFFHSSFFCKFASINFYGRIYS